MNATITPWQIISELDEVQELGKSQIRIRNLDTNFIFNLRSAIVSLEQRVLFYEGIIANLLTPEKEALISEDGVQQIQLGNTTAIYQCQKVIEFTPIFTRKTNNECFNDIPIVLPGTQDLPFTQCVWPKDVPLFLVQFMKYTYNKSADIMTKNNLANEYRKVILSLNSTTTKQNEDYTLGQTAFLVHMNKLGYYWKCPHLYSPRKVRFIDPTTRQIISYSNPIPCDTRTNIYVKYNNTFYLLSHSGLSLVNRTTAKINQ